ncbi:MAG: 50S ribosomal protein L16 [Candidatus Magasanikbacteria bacterium CG11_big_fil_rev_8_21_14_0_20_43_7]|uniref:Large ribosomal subunit protein uL16 n=1 Tax=Candidatus Magasanikbacteria bacterium CG11_big_fil_rev_8_21_14_0_20_43_7 TaxID=1974654 RepID=A0A2H0N4C6_9BACT|nr:MAG: 50S ribosomal protein L16 [Candidatus Magasanikbacteria bacterium CG11_big_fil_rev_8_21_14_0_20_43_7]
MLIPKKVQHRKWHKPRRGSKGVASRMNTVAFGTVGVVATTHSWVTSRQIESARRVLTRYVRRGGKVWIRIFPDRPVTKKGSEVPMGKGKGAPDHYVCTVKPGTVMFEMGGIPDDKAVEALQFASYKLPVKTKIITKL